MSVRLIACRAPGIKARPAPVKCFRMRTCRPMLYRTSGDSKRIQRRSNDELERLRMDPEKTFVEGTVMRRAQHETVAGVVASPLAVRTEVGCIQQDLQ